MPATTTFAAVLLTLLLPMASWADYLSHYGSGSGRYLSGYCAGSYGYGGGGGGGWNYGGPSGGTERKHRASWEAYQNAKARQAQGRSPILNLPTYNTWAARDRARWEARTNYGGNEVGAPCGNYNRTNPSCHTTTTRYNPLIHGRL